MSVQKVKQPFICTQKVKVKHYWLTLHPKSGGLHPMVPQSMTVG